MKKFMLTLMAVLALSGKNVFAANIPPAESGHDYNMYHDPFSYPRAENSPWRLWPDDTMEIYYTELKNAVFAKMGKKFADAFNVKYPQPSVEAVEELALYIDAITPWQLTYPPKATATIGVKRIALRGDIASIISEMVMHSKIKF